MLPAQTHDTQSLSPSVSLCFPPIGNEISLEKRLLGASYYSSLIYSRRRKHWEAHSVLWRKNCQEQFARRRCVIREEIYISRTILTLEDGPADLSQVSLFVFLQECPKSSGELHIPGPSVRHSAHGRPASDLDKCHQHKSTSPLPPFSLPPSPPSSPSPRLPLPIPPLLPSSLSIHE